MQALRATLLTFAVLTLPLAALADGHKHKQDYWDGHCKVKIREKHGEYEEKRKCKGPQQVYAPAPAFVVPQQPVLVVPAPVVLAPQPVHVPASRAAEPSLTIRANIPFK